MFYKSLFPGGKPKALTLSYDDGVVQDLRLMDIMRRYGIKGTFNVNTGIMKRSKPFVGEQGKLSGRMSVEQVKESYDGFELAIHGYNHPFLEQLPRDVMASEIALDRHELEQITGYPVRGMAYPYGSYSKSVIEQLHAMGVVYSRTTLSTGEFALPTDFLTWHPTCHHNDKRLDELADRFLADTGKRPLKTFYLWGHSFEFDNNDNWELIERFCEKMSGKEDIWYATNIEIYDYVQALDRLVASCDGSLFYNPSAIDVWVAHNAGWNQPYQAFCVPAGQVVRLEA